MKNNYFIIFQDFPAYMLFKTVMFEHFLNLNGFMDSRWSSAALKKWRGRWTCTAATWPSATRRSSSWTSSSAWWRWRPAWPSASGGGCRTSCPTCTRRCCRCVRGGFPVGGEKKKSWFIAAANKIEGKIGLAECQEDRAAITASFSAFSRTESRQKTR